MNRQLEDLENGLAALEASSTRMRSIRSDYAIARLYPAHYSYETSGDGLAYINVRGTQGAYDCWFFSRDTYTGLTSTIAMALEDEEVKGIMLTINSPGGNVAGLFACAQSLLEARERKPILAYVTNMACSAAYLLASCCSRIVCEPYSEVGSCGVQVECCDWDKWYEKIGIVRKLFHSPNAKKKNLSPFTKEGEEALNRELAYAEDGYFTYVAQGRGMDKDKCIADFGQGAVLTAEEGLEAGMVDGIMTSDEAIAEFIASLGGDDDEEEIISPLTESEGKGADMEKNATNLAPTPSLDEVRSKAVAEERERVAALNELRTEFTASIIDDAVKNGRTVAEVAVEVAKKQAEHISDLEAKVSAMGPIKAQAEAEENVPGIPSLGASKVLSAEEEADMLAKSINESIDRR